jgi:dihydroxyacid dehydratase/phosphogluconate dehydratase
MAKTPKDLRSARWFAPDDLRSMGHRSRAMQMGLDGADWEGKPIIAIINTWSDLSPCHHHLRDRAEFVKKGVYQAGGMPVEMPVHSFAEQFLKPTSMLYRNMGAIEVEETLRSHPIDGAVLMGGCDKSTPALVMGAVSMGLPFIYLPAGAMLRGNYAGEKLGSGTDVWKYWDERRRKHQQGTMGRGPKRYRAQLRDLHDHGNSIYYDEHCRWLGAYPQWCLVDPCP